MKKHHRLLKRQLKKLDLKKDEMSSLEPFLENVNKAYQDFDTDIQHLETIIEKSSQELFKINSQLRNNVIKITSKLNRIAENIHEIIFETDINGHWTYLNPAWENITGHIVTDSLGEKCTSFFKNENLDAFFKKLADGSNPESINEIISFTNLKNNKVWIDITVKSLKNDGEHEGCIGSIVEITKLKEIESALIKSRDKEAHANEAKNEFLSTMSHEIRTPLNAVIGISHLLLLENPKPEQLENLNALKYSSEHLLGLVNNVLDFNKIESGSLELEHSDFSIHQVLNGLLSAFQNIAEEKQIKFQIKKDESLPDMLKGDSLRISQIFTNLISNGIKFTDKGKVTLDIEIIKDTGDTVQILFKVIDTGIGIAKEKLETIFDSFTQASSDTTRKYGGTGLGLAICTKLVALMNSTIDVKSKIGEGTTFSIVLELEKSKRKPNSTSFITKKTDSFSELKGLKVLVAEDNKMNILVIKKFLTIWEVDFDIAENGLIAVQKTEKTNYDIVLMDLQMPVMNGYDATIQIRKSAKTHNQILPIYALSASAAMADKNRVQKYGMNGHMSKPFKPTELYQTLKNHKPL